MGERAGRAASAARATLGKDGARRAQRLNPRGPAGSQTMPARLRGDEGIAMYKRILVVVDAVPPRAAVTEGIRLAAAHGAEVVLFCVLPHYVIPVTDFPLVGLPGADEFYRDARKDADRKLAAAAALAERAGVRSTPAVGSGEDDAQCIVDAARRRRCGLIVAGTAGRNAVMRLIGGSVIPGLISRSTLPVLVVRDRGRNVGTPAKRRPPAARKRPTARRRTPPTRYRAARRLPRPTPAHRAA